MGQIVCETLSQKNSSQKRANGVAQDVVGTEFRLSYHKKSEPLKGSIQIFF
jgi:hypothetical protein